MFGSGQRVTQTQTRIVFFGRDSVLGLGFLLKHRVRVISESLKKLYILLYFLYEAMHRGPNRCLRFTPRGTKT